MMMINLLPPEPRTPFWHARHFFAVTYFLVVVFLGIIWGYLLYAEQSMEAKLQQAKQEHELFKPTLAQMRTITGRQKAIATRQNILLSLTRERPPLYAGIARLGAGITDGVWLTEVAGDNAGLKIAGAAENYPAVNTFLARLREEAMFSEVVLIQAEQGRNDTHFEFRVKFREL